MATGSSLVVPMVLWGKYAPTHCISTVLMTPDGQCVITGCNDGQICIWDVLDHYQIAPRSLLFGHTAAISCLAMGNEHKDRRYVVSSSENGEMCLWDLSDGRCIESVKMDKIHSDIMSCHLKSAKSLRLVCNGYYDEVLIMDPLSLEVVYSLITRVEADWISACSVISPSSRPDDVFLAITNAGVVKVWTTSQAEVKGTKVEENESKQIRCLNAQTLKCCPGNLRTVLIVCSKYWQIYDASDFTLLCSEACRPGERWIGGDFIAVDRVIVWSSEGRGYLYKLPTNATPEHKDYHQQFSQTSVHSYYVLDIFAEHRPLDCAPALTYLNCHRGDQIDHLLVRGDSDGRVIIWTLPDVSERQMTLVRQESFERLPSLSPKSSTSLQNSWNLSSQPPPGILDSIGQTQEACQDREEICITATIYIPSQGKIVCGRDNGTIIIVPAIDYIKRLLLVQDHATPEMPTKTLSGHHGRVTCLLYPFNESTRYEPNQLLSGGNDFSVILWDIMAGVKIHTFTVHGGSLSQMTVPPGNCNPRILSCICSVASDHSVALLSLRERKCLLLASRHLYPVKMIKWRPLDDFMLVQTKDGVVTVWQMETGHLDRVIDGKTAEDVLNNCDENATPVEALTNPSITLVQALKRRNLATFRNLAHQKLQSAAHPNQPNTGHKVDLMKPSGFPLLIQGVKTNSRDPDAHVLFFDTEALIVHLLTEEYSLLSPAELEARGMNFPLGEKALPLQNEISDAQQTLAESSLPFINNYFYAEEPQKLRTVAARFKSIQRAVSEDVSPSNLHGVKALSVRQQKSAPVQDAITASNVSTMGRDPNSHRPRSDGSTSSSKSRLGQHLIKGQSEIRSAFVNRVLAPAQNVLKKHGHRNKHQLRGKTRSESVPASLHRLGQPSQGQQHDLESRPRVTSESYALKEWIVVGGKLEEEEEEDDGSDDDDDGHAANNDVFYAATDHSGLFAKAKEKADTVTQKIQTKMDAPSRPASRMGGAGSGQMQQGAGRGSGKKPDNLMVQDSLSMAIGELFMSCLHAWGLDPALDDLCLTKLGLHKPRCPISFGLLSHGGHMSLTLPGWHRKHATAAPHSAGPAGTSPSKLLSQRTDGITAEIGAVRKSSVSSDGLTGEDNPGNRSPKPPRPPPPMRRSSTVVASQQAYEFSTKLRWQISSAVTTQHLLSVISVANTLMGMSRAVFKPHAHRVSRRRESVTSNHGIIMRETDSTDSTSSNEDESGNSLATLQAQVKQGWSLLAALHCVLLPELVGLDIYKCPQLEMLARRWQDRCLEIREAAQALLLAELRRIQPEGRKTLLDKWAPFLPSYVDPELSLLSNAPHHYGDDDDYDEEDGILAGDGPVLCKQSVSLESRRKQATAIVMLGVIGAEFGHEMEPSRARHEEPKLLKGKGTQEGFSLTNYSLSRHTSKALTFLLLQPPSPKLPPHTPIRRAAIDLIGRGFTVWEPYLDVSAVLLGLLELSIDSNKLIPSTTYGLPLSPGADACRSARHALSLIATARPPAFVITMAKEVARYNALAQNAQAQNTQLQNVILARASSEILHIIELLVEKIPNDVADLIVEAMDVSMFCLDLSALKAKGLPELFPAICRFSMVAYCSHTKRVWVGARNGSLALYEMKQHARCQPICAHNGAITALAINQDGKYLATFSHVDKKLKFWQTASSSIFGIGSQQTKLIRSYSTPPISVSPVSNILKLVRLVWVDKTTVVLLTVDGQDHKYSV